MHLIENVVPKLKAVPVPELQRLTGLSRAALKAARAGRMPHPRNRTKIVAALSSVAKPG
jgi:hypothetical protein